MRKTINNRRVRGAELRDLQNGWLFDPDTNEVLDHGEEIQRPRTRGECEHAARPCPFVGCSMHLYLDVSPDNGSTKINFPHLEVWELPVSCALDIADELKAGEIPSDGRGMLPLERLAGALGLSYDRAYQVFVEAMQRAAEVAGDEVPEWPSGGDR
jgi:hypothetical protein